MICVKKTKLIKIYAFNMIHIVPDVGKKLLKGSLAELCEKKNILVKINKKINKLKCSLINKFICSFILYLYNINEHL